MLTAFGNSKIKHLGYYEVPIMPKDEQFIPNAFIVQNMFMLIEVILRTDIFENVL